MATIKRFTDFDLKVMLKTHEEGSVMRTDASGLTFILSKTSTGNRLAFYFRKRENNIRREIRLGTFPEMTIDEARAAWLEQKQKFDKGGLKVVCPEPVKIEHQQAMTFGELWTEWRKMHDYSLAETTKEKAASVYRTHLHFIADVQVNDITPTFVLNFLDPYISRGEVPTARRIGKAISACLDYGVFRQQLVVNPLLNLSRYLPKETINHYATFDDDNLEEDMRELFTKFSDASPKIQVLLYMYFYTLLRSVELRRLKVEDISGNVAVVKTKTLKEFKVPLSRQAMECVQWLKANKTGYHNPFLFEGMAEDGIISENTLNKELANRGYKHKLKVHGIRACGRQWLQTLPYAKESIIEQCLSHVVGNRTEQAYNRGVYVQERAKLMQEWSDFVQRCIGNNNAFMFK